MSPMGDLLRIRRVANQVFRFPASPGRVPYTYADDFLCLHPQIVPDEYVREPINSRCAAGLVIERWAEGINVDVEELALVLAEAYMEEHHLYLEETDA